MNEIYILKVLNQETKTNLEIKINFENEIIALFGKSGSGKTTFLRCIAGLTNPDKGIIKINNETWYSSEFKLNLTPQKRDVGFVFQEYALFPTMSVADNLKFALKDNKDADWFNKIIESVNISKFLDRKPESLSGGEKQRVAFARAVIRRPKILLMDEPLSALDYEARKSLQDEILFCQKEMQIPIFWVSHDLSEIQKISSRIIKI